MSEITASSGMSASIILEANMTGYSQIKHKTNDRVVNKTFPHLNSTDLQSGNAVKGLSGQFGSGDGDWRLSIESSLNFDAYAYMRTSNGFLTSIHDVWWHSSVDMQRTTASRCDSASSIATSPTIDAKMPKATPVRRWSRATLPATPSACSCLSLCEGRGLPAPGRVRDENT